MDNLLGFHFRRIMHKCRWERRNMTTRKFGLKIIAAAADDDNNNNNSETMKVLNFEMWLIHPVVKHINWT